MAKFYKMADIFTQKEMEAAVLIYGTAEAKDMHQALVNQIVIPVLPRINRITGQQNDPRYIAYMLEYAIMESTPEPK